MRENVKKEKVWEMKRDCGKRWNFLQKKAQCFQPFSGLFYPNVLGMRGSKKGSSNAWAIIGMLNEEALRNLLPNQFSQCVFQALTVLTVVLKQSTIHGDDSLLFLSRPDCISAHFLQNSEDSSSRKASPTCGYNVAELNNNFSHLQGGVRYLQ